MKSETLPRLFVIGDSITCCYGPYLRRFVDGVFQFDRKGEGEFPAPENHHYPSGLNGGDSSMMLAYLRELADGGKFHPDVLLLNCGLHDLRFTLATQTHQVPPDAYGENLEQIHSVATALCGQLIWVRVTSVIDEIHNRQQLTCHRYAADVDKYNQIADSVWGSHGIPLVDLFTFTQHLGGVEALRDHVHYTERVCEIQAAFIAGALDTLATQSNHHA